MSYTQALFSVNNVIKKNLTNKLFLKLFCDKIQQIFLVVININILVSNSVTRYLMEGLIQDSKEYFHVSQVTEYSLP